MYLFTMTGNHPRTLGMNRKIMNRNKILETMRNEGSLSKLTRNNFAL